MVSAFQKEKNKQRQAELKSNGKFNKCTALYTLTIQLDVYFKRNRQQINQQTTAMNISVEMWLEWKQNAEPKHRKTQKKPVKERK